MVIRKYQPYDCKQDYQRATSKAERNFSHKFRYGKGAENLNLMNTPKIITERLILRKFTVNDLDALFFIYADKEVNTYLPWFPIENFNETKVLLEERYLKTYLKPQGYHYAV